MTDVPAFHTSFAGSSLESRLRPQSKLTSVSMCARPFRQPYRAARSVVWFREGDMRVEDHPGLDAATAHTSDALAPLLVCTPRTKLQSLNAAKRLHRRLRERGSHLVLRFAADEVTGVIEFLKEYRADTVHVRMDVEHEARSVIREVADLADGFANVQTWATELREWDESETHLLSEIPDEYPKFLSWPERLKTPILESSASYQPEVILPGTELDDTDFPIAEVTRKLLTLRASSKEREEFDASYDNDQAYTRTIKIDPDGEYYAEELVTEFLRKSEAYEEPDLGRSISEVLRQGALSPGRIWQIVVEYERSNGRIWRPVYRAGAKQLLNLLEAREFTTLLARRDIEMKGTVDGTHEAKFWRWRGYLVRYVEEGPEYGTKNKPCLLLVHGFGASSHHFKRSIVHLKKSYRVYAIDLVGYGRSEKPPTQYTQDFWECVIWDFVEEVIGEPVFVAGNSIGGYLAMAFGADAHPRYCRGVCLINSAGKLEDLHSSEPASTKKDSLFQYTMKEYRFARMLAANFLLKSLRGRIGKTLKSVYPTNPDAADDDLAREIYRDSLDSGAPDVLASGLILPPPRSLSRLLQKFQGPLLVFQGELDPLNNAKQRANTIEAQYPDVKQVRVQAGHCPHEEVPMAFVSAISEWIDSQLLLSNEGKETVNAIERSTPLDLN